MEHNFKDVLRNNMISLLESKRGTQALLAKAINEQASYFTHIKRGHPVNAMHLKAVGIVFGPQKVLDLLCIGNLPPGDDTEFKDRDRGDRIVERLVKIESLDSKLLDKVEGYVSAIYDIAQSGRD
ncbi:MAG: hypothetical protein WBB23_06900 [Desulforhopalus sp.]